MLPRNNIWHFAILVVVSSLPIVTYAQAAPPNASKAGPSSASTPIKADKTPSQTQKGADAKAPLEGDPRLDVKITLHRQDAAVADVLRDLSKATHVKLTVNDLETSHSSLFFDADAVPLRDVLDGIAHLHAWEWIRRQDKTLELRPRPRPERLIGLRPQNEAQAEKYRQGRQFFSQFSNCPPAMQSALTDMSHNGIPYSSLPAAMQQTVENMLNAAAADTRMPFPRLPLPAAEESTIRLQSEGQQQEWGNTYIVDVFDGHSYVGLDFPMFTNPDDNSDQIVSPSEFALARWYGEKGDAVSRKAILNDGPRLKRLQVPVTLDVHDAALTDCLHTLAATTSLSFAANLSDTRLTAKGRVAVHKSVTIDKKPLLDVLDQLAALYSQTWGQTKSGIIVFHPAPEKPGARTANIP